MSHARAAAAARISASCATRSRRCASSSRSRTGRSASQRRSRPRAAPGSGIATIASPCSGWPRRWTGSRRSSAAAPRCSIGSSRSLPARTSASTRSPWRVWPASSSSSTGRCRRSRRIAHRTRSSGWSRETTAPSSRPSFWRCTRGGRGDGARRRR